MPVATLRGVEETVTQRLTYAAADAANYPAYELVFLLESSYLFLLLYFKRLFSRFWF